jgi:5'-nucleotidase / UDP-sugar diphosphatase
MHKTTYLYYWMLTALLAGGSGCTTQHDAPLLAGQDVRLTVIHTADLHSRFFPYYFAPGQVDKGLGLLPKPGQDFAVVGGIGRISSVIKCIRGAVSPVCDQLRPLVGPPAARAIHVDSGDIWEGAPVFNTFNGEVEMRAMSQIGLTAMALGNHEFDKGAVNLEEQYQRFGGFPILAANYQFEDPNDPTQPKLRREIGSYVVLNVDGLKIGLIGLGNLSSIQGIIQGGNSLGVRPLEPHQAISDTVSIVRPQVDVLGLISHLGLDEDEGVAAGDAESRDQNTAVAVDGVDVIFGGHLHIVLDPPKDLPHLDTTEGGDGHVLGHTVLCHSGAFAKYVGRLDLVVHVGDPLQPTDKSGITAYTYRIIPIDDSIPSDPEMDDLTEPYQLQMNRFLNLNQVYAVVPCPVNNAGNCPKTQRNDSDGGDSQLGNLVATSMQVRHGVEADYALTNSLGIRADFESGPLNLEEMYNVFPFENTITTVSLSGRETQEMMDGVAVRSAERGCRTQAQVSGIYMDLVCVDNDPDCNSRQDLAGLPHSACAKNIYIGDKCRMPDGTFNGTKCRALDSFAEYRVAVNDYIATGGSGFNVLQRNTSKFNTGISLRNSLVDYIRSLPNRCTDPSQFTNIVGVTCKDKQSESYDCTAVCGGDQMASCTQQGLAPAPYDFRDLPCLAGDVQSHDGRIQTFTTVTQ